MWLYRAFKGFNTPLAIPNVDYLTKHGNFSLILLKTNTVDPPLTCEELYPDPLHTELLDLFHIEMCVCV